MQKILIIDDDNAIRKLLTLALKGAGYVSVEAVGVDDGLQKALSENPELVLLDIGLGDDSGFLFLRQLREWSDIPVIIISAINQEEEKIAALNDGADDYLTKPFSTNELLARIKAALRRRSNAVVSHILECGTVWMDMSARVVKKADEELKLTPKEYELLKLLLQNSGKVLTHNWLLKEVWGVGYQNETHYLRVFINQLRQKIENDPSRPRKIVTETGIGYRMVCT